MRTHRKGGCRCLTLSEPIQLEVGLQIPRGVYPEEAAEGIVWQTPPSPRGDFHALARQKECQILEGHLLPDHVNMCIAIPPKHPVASVIGFLKGRAPLPMPDCAARSVISRASISGPAAMPYPRSGLSWSRSANTSASQKWRMAQADPF